MLLTLLIIIQLRHETHVTVDIQERQSQFLPPDFSWGSSQGGATVTGKHVTCRRPRDDHYCAGSSIKVNISIDLLQQVTICVRVRRAGRGDLSGCCRPLTFKTILYKSYIKVTPIPP